MVAVLALGQEFGHDRLRTAVAATVSPGARVEIPWNPEFNALVYVLGGDGTVGPDGQPVHTGQLAVFGEGDTITVAAHPTQESAQAPAVIS